jgi:hypothetical protein
VSWIISVKPISAWRSNDAIEFAIVQPNHIADNARVNDDISWTGIEKGIHLPSTARAE